MHTIQSMAFKRVIAFMLLLIFGSQILFASGKHEPSPGHSGESTKAGRLSLASAMIREAWAGNLSRSGNRQALIAGLVADVSIPESRRFEMFSSSANADVAMDAGLSYSTRVERFLDIARQARELFPNVFEALAAEQRIEDKFASCNDEYFETMDGGPAIEIDASMPETVIRRQEYAVDVAAISGSAPCEIYVFKDGIYQSSGIGGASGGGLAHVSGATVNAEPGIAHFTAVARAGGNLSIRAWIVRIIADSETAAPAGNRRTAPKAMSKPGIAPASSISGGSAASGRSGKGGAENHGTQSGSAPDDRSTIKMEIFTPCM